MLIWETMYSKDVRMIVGLFYFQLGGVILESESLRFRRVASTRKTVVWSYLPDSRVEASYSPFIPKHLIALENKMSKLLNPPFWVSSGKETEIVINV